MYMYFIRPDVGELALIEKHFVSSKIKTVKTNRWHLIIEKE